MTVEESRALTVAINSLRFNPDLSDIEIQNYEIILANMRNGQEAAPASPWRPATKPPEDEAPVIAQYHFDHPAQRLEYTGILSYFACDPKPHWQHESMGVIVDRWMPVPPV